jgi:hypothetical protein
METSEPLVNNKYKYKDIDTLRGQLFATVLFEWGEDIPSTFKRLHVHYTFLILFHSYTAFIFQLFF